jgi:hypothetical protein
MLYSGRVYGYSDRGAEPPATEHLAYRRAGKDQPP